MQLAPSPFTQAGLREMLMMQCADPNTLLAPSRLHQLGQSLSPSASFTNAYCTPLSTAFQIQGSSVLLVQMKIPYCPHCALLAVRKSVPLCNVITHPGINVSFLVLFFSEDCSVNAY